MNRCKEIKLKCPKNFIRYNAPKEINGEFKEYVFIDECMVQEIKLLWENGIRTAGCCCGHGKYEGFINVFDESIKDMHNLGYELWDWIKMYPNETTRPDFAKNRKDTFKSKSRCKYE